MYLSALPHARRSMLLALTLLAIPLLLALASLPAHAKRVALVVGNAAYQSESVLRNPVNDATDMAQALRGLGVQVFENKAHTNQSRQDMNALIGRFLNAAEGADLAVVFYAGHGIQSAGASYLLPTDTKITDERSVRTEGISLNDLLADGADKRISRLVVILDACRNNPYATRTRSTARGLAPPRETNGTLIAYATADGQVADDGSGRNGVYTEQLLKQLRTNGQQKSVRDLLEDTQLAVTKAKPDQRPKVYGDSALFRDVGWGGSIQLASVGVVPTGQPVQVQTDPEQEAWDMARQINTAAAFQGYLNVYPSGRFASPARVAIAGLQPPTSPQPITAEQPAWDWVGEYILPWKGTNTVTNLKVSGTSSEPKATFKLERETELKEINFSDNRLSGIFEMASVLIQPHSDQRNFWWCLVVERNAQGAHTWTRDHAMSLLGFSSNYQNALKKCNEFMFKGFADGDVDAATKKPAKKP